MMLLDSNIVIGYLNGETEIIKALNALKTDHQALFISSITIAEALSFSSVTSDKQLIIEQFLDGFIVIQPDKEIAKIAASLRREHGLDIPDAFIAATAMVHHIPLATRDKKIQAISNVIFANI